MEIFTDFPDKVLILLEPTHTKPPNKAVIKIKTMKRNPSNRMLRFTIGVGLSSTLVLMAFEWRSPQGEKMAFFQENSQEDAFIMASYFPEPKVKEQVSSKPIQSPKEIIDEFKLSPEPLPEPKPEQNPDPDFKEGPEIEQGFTNEGPSINDEPSVSNPMAVHDLPYFKSCGRQGKKEHQEACLNDGLRNHLAQHLRYPEEAKRHKIESKIYVRFIIEKDGSIQLQEIAGKQKEYFQVEVERVFSLLPTLEPGKVQGRPVRVSYALPISFKLQP